MKDDTAVRTITLDIYGNVMSDTHDPDRGQSFGAAVAKLKLYSVQLLAIAAKLEHEPQNLGGNVASLRDLDVIMVELNKL